MGLKFSQIRAAFASQITTISGFNLSRQLPDYFGRTRESKIHKSFTVSVPITNEVVAERQRRGVGAYVTTSVQVRFAFRLRPLDIYPTDYDNSLDAEELVINKCLSSYASIQREVIVRYNGSTRQATESQEYMIHILNFTVHHTIGE